MIQVKLVAYLYIVYLRTAIHIKKRTSFIESSLVLCMFDAGSLSYKQSEIIELKSSLQIQVNTHIISSDDFKYSNRNSNTTTNSNAEEK